MCTMQKVVIFLFSYIIFLSKEVRLYTWRQEMRRRKPPAAPQLTDEEHRLRVAAQLVGTRIALGLAPAQVLERIGYTYANAARAEKRGLKAEKWAVYKLALIENSLHNAYPSTLQRYARAIGVAVHLSATRPNPGKIQRLKMRRVHQKAALNRKGAARNI